MKNLFFGLAFMLMCSVGFAATNNISKELKSVETFSAEVVSEFKDADILAKICYYDIVNAAGETIGHVIMEGVPDNVDCGSKGAKARAVSIFQNNG